MYKLRWILLCCLCSLIFIANTQADDDESSGGEVLIAPSIREIQLSLYGQHWSIQRNQDPSLTLTPLYTNTTVGYLQPIQLAQDVETLGELEVLAYLQKMQYDNSIIILDTRPYQAYERLHIPGAINAPLKMFNNELAAIEFMEHRLNVIITDTGELDFRNAKTVIAYSNGHYCAMTPYALKNSRFSLLNLGYPPQKIKYYRGGMQGWTSVGLTVSGKDNF